MARLLNPERNHYDVLGVPPDASQADIKCAFDWLIGHERFRIGLSPREQPARLQDIKTAYAMLGDPEKRRAYDQSLDLPSERPLWPKPGNDAQAEPSVAKARRPRRPRRTASKPKIGPPVPGNDKLRPPAPTEPVVGERAEAVTADLPEPEANASPQSERILVESFPAGAFAANREPAANLADRRSAKTWGMATAGVVALGAALFAFWPGGTPEPAGPNQKQPVTAEPVQTGPEPAASPTESASVQQAQPGSGVIVWPAPPSEIADSVPGLAAETLVTETAVEAQPSAEAAGGPAKSAQPAPALPSAQAPASQSAVTAPLPAPAEGSGGASVTPRAPVPAIRSPAYWIGGGPTNADNRRGRYRGTVAVQFTVQPSGRASNCAPVRSSGNAHLDALTCRLVEERVRFSPAVDANGQPVASQATGTFVWGRGRRATR